MDELEPVLINLLSRIADGSLGEAGGRLWGSLTGLVRRGPETGEPAELPPAIHGAAPEEIAAVANLVARNAASDEKAEAAIRRWIEQAQTVTGDGSVSNTVSGDVAGKVVQARDIGNLRL